MNDRISPPLTAHGIYGGLLSAQGLDLQQREAIRTEVHTWRTDAGTGVTFVEARGLPIVDVVLRFNAGTASVDPPSLAALTLYMLDEGSLRFNAAEHAQRIERLGAVVEKQIRHDYATLSLRSVSTKALLDPAIELFTSLATQPAFPAPALEKVKRQLVLHDAARARQPVHRARSEAYRHLFSGHPYGQPQGSTAQALDAVTPADLRAFHRRAYSATNLEMVVVGDLSRIEAQAMAQRISQALPQGWAAAELPAAPQTSGTSINIEQAGAGNAVLFALPIDVPANDPEYLALKLACEVLSVGSDSRLMKALRKHRGLTYDIYSQLVPKRVGGLFAIEWEIAPPYVKSSQALVEALLHDLVLHGPTEAELQLACQQLAGQLLRTVAQNKRLAELLTETTQERQPADHLNTYNERLAELTPAAVRDVMQRRFDLTRRVLVSVGPAADQQPLPASDQ
ncbi:pitrilysin family protein [Pseudomonas sp. B21-031]|jgi:zinc protease|uniref:M16 family metallopeptidase n=1 Tax=Pseudomonas TaxID=286 RepID=UPI00215E3D6D|nr:pitrilysin family protein [Pseudomonas sp. B21-031]UVL66664.1 insulinase family protein [Pseudomonas sp. B21-031]